MKTLVFCTSYHETAKGWEDRQAIWIKALHKSNLHFDKLLIVDDASPVLPDWPDLQIITEEQQPRVEDLDSDHPIILYTHTKRLGRASVFEFPGWYRSFAFGALYGAMHNFEKIIHLESDAFLISSQIQAHFNSVTTGWFAVWCEAYHFPEIAIQVAAGDEIRKMVAFVREPYAQMQGQIHEFVFPFTHIERSFVGNRYGEMIGHVPRHADYCAQTHAGRPDAFYWWIKERCAGIDDYISAGRWSAPFEADTLEGSWSGPEVGHHWMLDFDSILYIPPVTLNAEYEILLDVAPCLYQERKQQTLFVLVNARLIHAVVLYRATTILCRLPVGSLSTVGSNQMRFLHPDAFVPSQIGPHPEKRKLSIALAAYELRTRDSTH